MIDMVAVVDAVASHALASGWFDRVNQHEPKAAPGHGLTAAVWADRIGPAPAGSGLAATSGLLVLNVRAYTSMLSEPLDALDPNLLTAVGDLMGAYSGDFELGGLIRNVDLLGQTGISLAAQAGYLEIDRKMFRIMTITVPMIVNDLWDQVA